MGMCFNEPNIRTFNTRFCNGLLRINRRTELLQISITTRGIPSTITATATATPAWWR